MAVFDDAVLLFAEVTALPVLEASEVVRPDTVVLCPAICPVLVGLAVLAKRLVVVDDWLVPVVCCEVVGRTVVPELVAMLPVPVVCPVEEAVPLVLGVTRLALEVCTEPVDR